MKEAFSVKGKKQTLRKEMLASRRALSTDFVEKHSVTVVESILQMKEFRSAYRIMAYLAMPDEVNVDALISRCWEMGKEVYVPFCLTNHEMEARQLRDWNDVEIGKWGIRTAGTMSARIEPSAVDLVLLSGTACDRAGRRLGMGAGYYDRFLGEISFEKRVVLIWDFQVVSRVPTEDVDERIAKVITEKQVITVQRS